MHTPASDPPRPLLNLQLPTCFLLPGHFHLALVLPVDPSRQLGRMTLYRRLHRQVCLPCVLLVEERDKESSL